MEQLPQVQQQASSGGGAGAGAAANAVVAAGAATMARWKPTQEQVRILKELYQCGIQSPNAEQIQRIAARLRQFGGIEGKNVYDWFRNSRKRDPERHKERLAVHTSSSLVAGDHLGALCSGAAAASSSGVFLGAGNGGCLSAASMNRSKTACWGDGTWMAGAAAAAASGGFLGTVNGGCVLAAPMGGSTTTSSANGRTFVQLQDYMGVTRTTGAGSHVPAAQRRWPPWFFADQTTTREPETLPLFPTGGHYGGGGHGSYMQLSNFNQEQHLQLQEQQQYSLPSHDAGISLELSLNYGHM